jgi:hypothetical protein
MRGSWVQVPRRPPVSLDLILLGRERIGFQHSSDRCRAARSAPVARLLYQGDNQCKPGDSRR